MQKSVSNPYLDQIKVTLPRILSLIDRDETSASYGLVDRFHWSWGLIDFQMERFKV